MSNRKDVQQNGRRSHGSAASNGIAKGDAVSSSPRKAVARQDEPAWQDSQVTVGGKTIRTYQTLGAPKSPTTSAPKSPIPSAPKSPIPSAPKSPLGIPDIPSGDCGRYEAYRSYETGKESVADVSMEASGADQEASWCVGAKVVCCINTYPNGITVSLHDMDSGRSGLEHVGGRGDAPVGELHAEIGGPAVVELGTANGSSRLLNSQQFHLRFRDTRDYLQPTGRYFLYREQYLRGLEKHLSQLHHQGILENTVVYFGTTTDPFLTLHKKFDVTMACLQILERYTPKLLVVQTRSPMVISALPTLKHLGARAVVGIPVETFLEKAVLRYMPGKPRIAERIVAADGLRKQGIRVNLMVSPVLPYGDFERDAWDFAELLVAHGDFITFGSLATGSESEERALKTMPIAQKLAADKQFLWLRPYSYKPVYQAVKALAPEKLILPVKPVAAKGQLNLFAA